MHEDDFTLKQNDIRINDLNGIYSEFANLLGMEAVLQIHKTFRGQQISFPVELFSKDYIKQRIVAESAEQSVKALATKYGYSEKWILKILKDHAEAV